MKGNWMSRAERTPEAFRAYPKNLLSYRNTSKPRFGDKNSFIDPRGMPDRWPVPMSLLFLLVIGGVAWAGIIYLVLYLFRQ